MATEDPAAKRARLYRDILGTGRLTRTGLATALSALHSEGALVSSMESGTERQLRREVQAAIETHAHSDTPYGRVVQKMDLGVVGLRSWEFVNPFAFLYHLCAHVPSFASMMHSTTQGRQSPLRLVLYIDELTPGNPLRPDKGRTTHAIYWVFADWPQAALQRNAQWLLFGVVRSSLVNGLPAGASSLMASVLRVFFHPSGHNFQRGVFLPMNGGTQILVQATFSGLLADLKAHQEVFMSKGQAATKPCQSCKNVIAASLDETNPSAYLVSICCSEYKKFDPHTRDSVYEIIDRLRQLKRQGARKGVFLQEQQVLGYSDNPDSLLNDTYLREIVNPVDHCLRDWMHCLVSGGAAGTEMALVLTEVVKRGATWTQLQEYAACFRLPKGRGRVDTTWFSAAKVGDDQLKAFASEQLTMLPIVEAFLTDFADDLHLSEHLRCFRLLSEIVGICSLGPHKAMPFVDQLQATIEAHHKIYLRLYSVIKPKWHHMMHLPDHMRALGCLLSCFVTERKHRAVKSSACHVFRHFEHAVVSDLVNRQVHDLMTLKDSAVELIDPRCGLLGIGDLRWSTVARLECSEVHKGDFVCLTGKRVGKVEQFFSVVAGEILVQVSTFSRKGSSDTLWDTSTPTSAFVNDSDIVAPVTWAAVSETTVRVCLPFLWGR